MYTVCPNCQRQFRLYAKHIAAAAGQVRCGFCQTQFNAMERLFDQPLTRDQVATLAYQARQPVEEPQFEIPEQQENENLKDEDVAVNVIQSDEVATSEQSSAAVQAEQSEPATAELTSESNLQQQDERAEPEVQYAFDSHALDLEETDEHANSRMSGMWSAGVLTAVVILGLQLAWFQRDRVLLDYPELRPYVQQLCDRLDCAVIRERDTRAISLVNRDVRLHPAYRDTLLVNATMQNELNVRQPYPQVQLTLFDTTGTLIGYREFEPGDYLDASIDVDKGMPVNSPVHFVLELAGSSEEAVSFEFRFL